jgi:hypothetical protein
MRLRQPRVCVHEKALTKWRNRGLTLEDANLYIHLHAEWLCVRDVIRFSWPLERKRVEIRDILEGCYDTVRNKRLHWLDKNRMRVMRVEDAHHVVATTAGTRVQLVFDGKSKRNTRQLNSREF